MYSAKIAGHSRANCRAFFLHDFKPIHGAWYGLRVVTLGKGRLIAGELNLEAGKSDPIAGRLLMNLIGYLKQQPDFRN